ncbi:hypothetical protein AC1031_003786 [Aphanomyces cochlioides]|nr:hypothetical protein AC1031_003786 [Aphanomyces cochlioides]
MSVATEFSLLQAWSVRVPEPSRERIATMKNRDEYLILHPKQRPPSTATHVARQSCQPQCSLSSSKSKRVDLHTTVPASRSSPTMQKQTYHLRKPSTFKRGDSMKSIIEHDASSSGVVYHALRGVRPQEGSSLESRSQLRHVRDAASGKTKAALHLAEALVVCDKDCAMKRHTAAKPPWTKGYLTSYLTQGAPRTMLQDSVLPANDAMDAPLDAKETPSSRQVERNAETIDETHEEDDEWSGERDEIVSRSRALPSQTRREMNRKAGSERAPRQQMSSPPRPGSTLGRFRRSKTEFKDQVESWNVAMVQEEISQKDATPLAKTKEVVHSDPVNVSLTNRAAGGRVRSDTALRTFLSKFVLLDLMHAENV